MDSLNATHSSSRTVAVLLPLPLAGPYDYAVPDGVALSPGDIVTAPLGARQMVGVVWGAAKGGVAPTKLKPVRAKLDLPPLPDDLRRFIDWVAAYTLAAPGAVLRLAMRAPSAMQTPQRLQTVYRAGGPLPEKITPARERVLACAKTAPLSVAELARKAEVSTSVVRGLVDAGTLLPVVVARACVVEKPDAEHPGPQLSEHQTVSARAFCDAVQAQTYSCSLLHGVTGSGKTEVYFEAITQALRQGKQALVLLPEIALTVQFLERFAARFGCLPAQWHSQLAEPKRRDIWRAVACGEARVVVGARSALYLPFAELGLIIVDEEHDAAYKQEDGVTYHARDMAVVRAHLTNIPIVLSSATPSLETMVNAQTGRYRHLLLPDRHGGALLPGIEAVDMRAAGLPAGQFLSPRLAHLMAQTLARGEQVLLFLNRRGYAPLTLCRACGSRMECPNCSAWLVEHRFHNRMLCHHCGHEAQKPKACPTCGEADRLVACGPGIERLAEEVAGAFPEFIPAILSGDNSVAQARETIAAFTRGETRLLIGTQIVAKGHHFPGLTLVGVIDADLGLAGGDLRAAERTFQMLHQVSGRAGREKQAGRAVLQTYMPEHPVMQALISGNQAKFLEAESAARQARTLPPFGRLAALIISGPDQEQVRGFAVALARAAPHGANLHVLGPAPAPLALLRGRHRTRLLLMATRQHDVQALLRAWLARVKIPPAVRLSVDVDPYSFM